MFQINTPYFVTSTQAGVSGNLNKPTSKHESNINAILSENNQIRKILPDGDQQILKALSYAMFFTTAYNNAIHVVCNQHLLSMIKGDGLTEKLQIFKNNMLLLRDFSKNPCENPTFEKALLELCSLVFKVKIVISSLSEDYYLSCLIINNRFENVIQLFKSGSHFDVLYERSKAETIKCCQELVYEEIISKKFGACFNSFNEWLVQSPELQLADFLLNFQNICDMKMKSKHKKSLSDNFNVSHEQMEAEQKKYYEMFSNLKEPEDFFKKLTPSAKSRFAEKFPNKEENNNHDSANINCDYFSNNLALKNYNLSPSNISSLNTSFTKVAVGDDKTSKNAKSLFFNETDLLNPENPFPKNTKSPIHFVGTPPPGLTPKKNTKDTPKSFQKLNEETKHGEIMDNNFKMSEGLSTPEKKDVNRNYYSYSPESNQNQNSLNYKGMTINTESDNSKHFSNFSQNKPQTAEPPKKMIIIDETEPKVRRTGRLKFFDENKSYGFIVNDEDGCDIFVHYDDLSKAGVNKELLKSAKHGNLVRFSFTCMNYIGKYNKSKKAVELELI